MMIFKIRNFRGAFWCECSSLGLVTRKLGLRVPTFLDKIHRDTQHWTYSLENMAQQDPRLYCDMLNQTSKLGLSFFPFFRSNSTLVTGQTGRDTMSQPDERDRTLTTCQLEGPWHPLNILTSPTGPQRTTIFKRFQLSMQLCTWKNGPTGQACDQSEQSTSIPCKTQR
jgi:hypothetical protein